MAEDWFCRVGRNLGLDVGRSLGRQEDLGPRFVGGVVRHLVLWVVGIEAFTA